MSHSRHIMCRESTRWFTAAAERGWLDGERAMKEAIVSIKRAGADWILTYGGGGPDCGFGITHCLEAR